MKFTNGPERGLIPRKIGEVSPESAVCKVRQRIFKSLRISVRKLSSPHSTQLSTAAAADADHGSDADTIESAEKDDERGVLIKLPLSTATAYVTPSCVRGNGWRQRYMRFAIF